MVLVKLKKRNRSFVKVYEIYIYIYTYGNEKSLYKKKKKGTKYHGRYNVNVYLKICNRDKTYNKINMRRIIKNFAYIKRMSFLILRISIKNYAGYFV